MGREILLPLIPFEAVLLSPYLTQSVEENGVISPLILCGGKVVDGIARLRCSPKGEIPVRTVEGNPYVIRWALNLGRPWNPVETALVWKGLPVTSRPGFLGSLSIGPSPLLPKVFNLIADSPERWPALTSGLLSMAILRDLGVTGEAAVRWLDLFVSMRGSMGSKRKAAALVKACTRRGTLPEDPVLERAQDLIALLHPLAHPVQNSCLERFEEAAATLDIPPRVHLSIDETLEEEGVTVRMQVTRENLQVLEDLKKALANLFQKVDFL